MSDVGRGPPTEEGERARSRQTGSISSESELSTEAGTGERTAPDEPLPALPRTGDVVAERYRIERSLGAGGMGHVYLAEHTALQKRFAIKILSPQVAVAGDEQAARFLREARAGSRLSHPGIVEINDFGTTDSGLPFFVMEHLEGEDLGYRLDREECLPWPAARDLMLQMLDALSVAHASGVIHRDLKPENCFLTKSPSGEERLKLVDFGIAKLLTESNATTLTADGKILGTPHYMSPEQALGKDIDTRADIYSATVILFELLTGRPPFNEGSAMAILSQHLSQPPPSIREVDSTVDIPYELEEIIAQGLAKEPRDRFASVDDFAAALRALGASEAAVLPAGAFGEPTAAKRPWGAVLGALVVGGGLLLAFGALREQSASNTPNTPTNEVSQSSMVAERGGARPASTRTSAKADPARSASDAQDDTQDETGRGDTGSTESGSTTGETALMAQDDTSSTGDAEPTSTGSTGSPPPKDHSGHRSRPRPRDPGSQSKPSVLEDGLIKRRLQAALTECRKWGGPGGATLKVRLSIAASGAVSGTSIAPPYAGDHPLGRCAARSLNKAELPAAEHGRDFAGNLRISGVSLGP